MSENDHQPVTFAGLLLLAAVAVVFLVIIWLIGTAFARAETFYRGETMERIAHVSVILS